MLGRERGLRSQRRSRVGPWRCHFEGRVFVWAEDSDNTINKDTLLCVNHEPPNQLPFLAQLLSNGVQLIEPPLLEGWCGNGLCPGKNHIIGCFIHGESTTQNCLLLRRFLDHPEEVSDVSSHLLHTLLGVWCSARSDHLDCGCHLQYF